MFVCVRNEEFLTNFRIIWHIQCRALVFIGIRLLLVAVTDFTRLFGGFGHLQHFICLSSHSFYHSQEVFNISGLFWTFPVHLGLFWSIRAIFSVFWPCSAIFCRSIIDLGQFRPIFTIFQPILATFGHFQPIYIIFQLILATFGHFPPFLSISSTFGRFYSSSHRLRRICGHFRLSPIYSFLYPCCVPSIGVLRSYLAYSIGWLRRIPSVIVGVDPSKWSHQTENISLFIDWHVMLSTRNEMFHF